MGPSDTTWYKGTKKHTVDEVFGGVLLYEITYSREPNENNLLSRNIASRAMDKIS